MLSCWVETKADPRSPTGSTYHRNYKFKAPYDRLRRPEITDLSQVPTE